MKKRRLNYNRSQLEDIKRTIRIADDTGDIIQVSETGLPAILRPSDTEVLEELESLEGFQEYRRHEINAESI